MSSNKELWAANRRAWSRRTVVVAVAVVVMGAAGVAGLGIAVSQHDSQESEAAGMQEAQRSAELPVVGAVGSVASEDSADGPRTIDARTDDPTTACPSGYLPSLETDRHPDGSTRGATTVAAAVQELAPNATRNELIQHPLGPGTSAPVWVIDSDQTFIVTPAPKGGWFASKATLTGCGQPPTKPEPAGGPTP